MAELVLRLLRYSQSHFKYMPDDIEEASAYEQPELSFSDPVGDLGIAVDGLTYPLHGCLHLLRVSTTVRMLTAHDLEANTTGV